MRCLRTGHVHWLTRRQLRMQEVTSKIRYCSLLASFPYLHPASNPHLHPASFPHLNTAWFPYLHAAWFPCRLPVHDPLKILAHVHKYVLWPVVLVAQTSCRKSVLVCLTIMAQAYLRNLFCLHCKMLKLW